MANTSHIGPRWKSVRAFWRVWGWPVIWALAVASFASGYVGFAQYYRAQGESFSVLELVCRTIQRYVLQSGALDHSVPPALDIARFLAPAVFGYTATRALMSLLREQ
ncbi:MAG: hypothetical protein IT366_23355, partial [Candidatus Hydrogenedentes bacterium]|nr:hypothetical protein [Candidatus Hydrogenedentota bacterium]